MFITKIAGMLFKKGVKEAKPVVQHLTRSSTDSSTGVVKMTRNFTHDGGEVVAHLVKNPDGTRKLTILGPDELQINRTKHITREKGGSVFDGDKVTVNCKESEYSNKIGDTIGYSYVLDKEYTPQGILEHKRLEHENFQTLRPYLNNKVSATQDRVYDGVPLSSGIRDMLKWPRESQYIKHSAYGMDNYNKFPDGAETNYLKAKKAKEEAAAIQTYFDGLNSLKRDVITDYEQAYEIMGYARVSGADGILAYPVQINGHDIQQLSIQKSYNPWSKYWSENIENIAKFDKKTVEEVYSLLDEYRKDAIDNVVDFKYLFDKINLI